MQGAIKSIISLVLVLVICLSVPSTSHADTIETGDYTHFFSEFGNILLFRPNLVSQIFQGIIEEGKGKNISRRIRYEVLGCQTDSKFLQGCRIDQLRLQRKKQQLSNDVVIPVNFTRIGTHRISGSRKRVSLYWSPELFKPASESITNFLHYINAASDSKLFTVKNGIDRIQLNVVFEKKATIITDAELADNLLKLHKFQPKDYKDHLTFQYDYITQQKRNRTMDFFIHFKVVKVKTNHLSFRAVQL